ncbi:MAG: AtpZ/AtpI family protein [Gemmatimonadota bacterium]
MSSPAGGLGEGDAIRRELDGVEPVAGNQRGKRAPGDLIRVSGEYMGYGLAWALSVLLFLGGGAWLDKKLGTSPVFLVVGAFLGAAAGFYSMYYHIVIEPRKRTDSDR